MMCLFCHRKRELYILPDEVTGAIWGYVYIGQTNDLHTRGMQRYKEDMLPAGVEWNQDEMLPIMSGASIIGKTGRRLLHEQFKIDRAEVNPCLNSLLSCVIHYNERS